MTVSACARLTCRTTLVFMLCLLAGIRPGSAAADLSSKILFDIPPQQMGSALLKYSAQSGIQVTSSADAVEERVSGGIVGTFVARDALDKLLAGSNLTYEVVDAFTVAIRDCALAPASAHATSSPCAYLPGTPNRRRN